MRLLLSTCLALAAQGQPAPKPTPGTLPPISSSPIKELVRADLGAEEAGTPEALVASLYAFISGPAGQKRNVEKIRSLFHLQARVIAVTRHPDKGLLVRPMELEAFLGFAVPQWEKGFYERPTAVTVQKQDGLAQVWTPYEIRLAADGPVMYTGLNALQCAWDGKRWWITHIEFQNAPTAALLSSLEGPKK